MARPTRAESEPDARWWNVKRAARELGYTQKWVRALCRKKLIPSHQWGVRGEWRIDPQGVREHQGRRQ